MKQPHYLLIGEILRPHGVQGEVRVRLLTDYPERLKSLKTVFLGTDPTRKEATRATLNSVRGIQDGYALMRLNDMRDRDEADTLRGLSVMIALADAVPLDDDEYYSYQLIGMTVETEAEGTIGTVSDVMETGANDVLVVESDYYGQVLLPAHDGTLVNIDFERGVILMQLPQGLLPS